MLQSASGSIMCSVCNASYASESALRDHQRASHRGRGSEERPKTLEVDAASASAQPPQE